MFCALSGEVPKEPVVSKTTGHVFERRLIETHLVSSTTCPITQTELSADDLIPLKLADGPVRPRAPATSSVAGLLTSFQQEWDALILETFTVRKQLESTRQELAHSLYQHDAACRVIARLIRERDQAQTALAQLTAAGASLAAPGAGSYQASASAPRPAVAAASSGSSGSSRTVLAAQFAEAGKPLTAARKLKFKSALPAGFASPGQVSQFSEQASTTVHLSSKPGVLCMALAPWDSGLLATGGADARVVVSDSASLKVKHTLRHHGKKVTAVQFHPTAQRLLSASADATVALWSLEGGGHCALDTSFASPDFSGPLEGLSVHPGGVFLAAAARDSWGLVDMRNGGLVHTYAASEPDKAFTGIQIHPDGGILATGDAAGALRVWDFQGDAPVVSLDGPAPLTAFSFAENGFLVAAGYADGAVNVFDLRKMSVLTSWTERSPVAQKHGVTALAFDAWAQYLAVGTDVVAVYKADKKKRDWEQLWSADDSAKSVHGLCWGPDAGFLVSGSKDRHVRRYQCVEG